MMDGEMQETVEAAKAEFLRAKGRLAKALETTPDDKINWSPSPTSRTPIHQVAHAAMSISGMQDWLSGKPFPFDDINALDSYSRTEEAKFNTREQVLGMLDENSNGYIAWLDSLSPEQVGSMFESAMGSFPMAVAITFPADHLRSHASQIDYIQTIYGDRDWHMG
jgi:hypothetical protein